MLIIMKSGFVYSQNECAELPTTKDRDRINPRLRT